jgi:hypothetical protein
MENDKRYTAEEAGKAVDPERSADTVKRWCKKEGLGHTKDGPTGRFYISHYALRKFCKRKGIRMNGETE